MKKKKNDQGALPPRGETILQRSMDEVMHQSMMPYAEHVILERALPRVEDGLKPVQRRILYTMLELGVSPDKPHRKSARIVGDALGKYHPHGDSSVYEAMVRMAQPFNMRQMLVDGHGNFGSIDGDSAAAMRYTEARMTPLAMEMLRDIEKNTVPFSLNFDDTLKEPDLLPGRFPNLLVNGATGIAVGLATNIPPHNLGEAIDAVTAQMDDPDISLEALMQHIPCPDFPTGGLLIDSEEIKQAYLTGRGKLTMRAKTHLEPQKNGKTLIVITELPYQLNKVSVLERILALSQEKKQMFSGIADIRDESDRMGMRAVIEVKKDADANRILQQLFKYSDLQCTFGVNMVAIAGGKPQQMGLKEIIAHYIAHQRDVVRRRTQFDLDNAKKREHIVQGLLIAVHHIDEVIALIRASKSPQAARDALMERFGLTQVQAQAILDLRLQRLTNLEVLAIEKEHEELIRLIAKLEGILGSEKKLMGVIKKELLAIKEQYADARRTQLIQKTEEPEQDETEPQVIAEDVTVVLYQGWKVRKYSGKTVPAAKQGDEVEQFAFKTRSDKRLRLFTNTGVCLLLPVDSIPEAKPNARATNLAALLPIEEQDVLLAAFEEDNQGKYYFYTKCGYVKCTMADQYALRTKRTMAISLKEGDALIGVETERTESLLLVSEKGMSIRFDLNTVPVMGRVSAGVKCMKLDENDSVCFAQQVLEEGEVLCITDRGYAKRSLIFDYDTQGRNGKGLKTFDFKKNGSNGTRIAAVFYVREPFVFDVIQRHGTVTTCSTEQVRIEQRASYGTMLVMTILDDDVVQVVRREE